MQDLTAIWREVSAWPTEDRRMLAARLLESVAADEVGSAVSPARQSALRSLIGVWKTTEPPNDDEIARIIDK